jgi:hypothetical protein
MGIGAGYAEIASMIGRTRKGELGREVRNGSRGSMVLEEGWFWGKIYYWVRREQVVEEACWGSD